MFENEALSFASHDPFHVFVDFLRGTGLIFLSEFDMALHF